MGLIASTMSYETGWTVSERLRYYVQDTDDLTTEVCTGSELQSYYWDGVAFDNVRYDKKWCQIGLYPCMRGKDQFIDLKPVNCIVTLIPYENMYAYVVFVDSKYFVVPTFGGKSCFNTVPIILEDRVCLQNVSMRIGDNWFQGKNMQFMYEGMADRILMSTRKEVYLDAKPASRSSFMSSLVLGEL